MGIDYSRLWKLLIDKKMTKTDLRLMAKLSTVTLSQLGKNKPVSLTTISAICNVLNCRIEDVVEYIPDEKEDSVK